MAVGPMNALVDEVLTCTADYNDPEALREEAVNLAFDMRLGAHELAELLAALELRTGVSLERRRGSRPGRTPKPLQAKH